MPSGSSLHALHKCALPFTFLSGDNMHDDRGREIPDPIPVAVPLQWRRPPTIQEQVRMYIRRELSLQAESEGQETFEEADDFDVGDDYDPTSPYEEIYEPIDSGDVEGPSSGPDGAPTGGGNQDAAGPGESSAQAQGGSDGGAGNGQQSGGSPPQR